MYGVAEELNKSEPMRGNVVHRFGQLWDLIWLHDVSQTVSKIQGSKQS